MLSGVTVKECFSATPSPPSRHSLLAYNVGCLLPFCPPLSVSCSGQELLLFWFVDVSRVPGIPGGTRQLCSKSFKHPPIHPMLECLPCARCCLLWAARPFIMVCSTSWGLCLFKAGEGSNGCLSLGSPTTSPPPTSPHALRDPWHGTFLRSGT